MKLSISSRSGLISSCTPSGRTSWPAARKVLTTSNSVFQTLISRCRDLDLRAPGSERKLVMDFTILLTAKTMHALFGPSRRKWIAL